MPIRMNCQCGKAINAPDAAAGKAIKCPGCAAILKVPAAGAPAAPSPAQKQAYAAPPAAVRSAQPTALQSSRMDDLFSEEGFVNQVAAVCPACRAEMTAAAVLCTKCGYNKQTGTRLDGHKTAGVDISHGEMALLQAKKEMARNQESQDRLLGNTGMPWWMLALILFLIVSSTAITVVAINVSRQVNGTAVFNPLATFLLLGFGACQTIAWGAFASIAIKAYKIDDAKQAALCFFVPFYVLYYVMNHWKQTGKQMIVSIVMGMIGSGFLAGAFAAGL